METQIIKDETTIENGYNTRSIVLELNNKIIEANIIEGEIWFSYKNTSNKTWKGVPKCYETVEELLNNYKDKTLKSLINSLIELIK